MMAPSRIKQISINVNVNASARAHIWYLLNYPAASTGCFQSKQTDRKTLFIEMQNVGSVSARCACQTDAGGSNPSNRICGVFCCGSNIRNAGTVSSSFSAMCNELQQYADSNRMRVGVLTECGEIGNRMWIYPLPLIGLAGSSPATPKGFSV